MAIDENVEALFAPHSAYENLSKIDDHTELISVQSYRVSDLLLEYLRSTLKQKFVKQSGNSDIEFIMVHSPRLLAFEIYIIEYGLRLLNKIGEQELFNRTSLEEDEAELKNCTGDWNMFTIIKLNTVTKRIFFEQVKTMEILKNILTRLATDE